MAVEKQPLKHFIKAEEYHQDYLKKNPNGYCHINVKQASYPVIDASKYKNLVMQRLKKLSDEEYAVTQKMILSVLFLIAIGISLMQESMSML